MKRNKDRLSFKLMIIFGALMLVMVAGSLVAMNILLSKVRETNDYQGTNYVRHYAFIHSRDNSEFWNDVYAGALEKGKEMGVYVENFGANLTVDYDTNELIRIAIDASVDGIILESTYDKETEKLINEASEAGIPVVTLMKDYPRTERISYVGISSYAMGRQYGERIVDHMPDDSQDGMRIVVIINSNKEEEGGASLVVYGIQDVFKERGYGNRLEVETLYIDGATAFSAEESIRDILLKWELPDAIVGLDAVHTRCLFQAAVDYNKVGSVYLYGFDDSEDILDAVRKNIMEATLSINTTEMGATCVEALEEYISAGNVSEYLSMDTDLIMTEQAIQLLKEYEKEE